MCVYVCACAARFHFKSSKTLSSKIFDEFFIVAGELLCVCVCLGVCGAFSISFNGTQHVAPAGECINVTRKVKRLRLSWQQVEQHEAAARGRAGVSDSRQIDWQ